MNSTNKTRACHIMTASLLVAIALTADPAQADFDGGSASQEYFRVNEVNANITINEGQATTFYISIRAQPAGSQSGFAGTTTTRLTSNSVVFSRTGPSGSSSYVSPSQTDATFQLHGGGFSFGQDGVHTISYSDNVPLEAVQNSSYSLGSQTNPGSYLLSNSRTVTVNNVAPTVISATQNGTDGTITVSEGSSVALHMESSDPGQDAQTFSINGTTAGIDTDTFGTRTSNSVNQPFNQDGTFTNTFAVTDDDTTTTVTRNLVVTNVAPTIVSATQNGTDGNITVNEGSTVALQMQSTDPGTDAQTFTINGTSAGTGGTVGTRTSNITNVAAVDEGTLTNTFAVMDDDTTSTLSRSVTVLNVAPSLFGLNVPGTAISSGQTATFSVSANDPGVLDDLTFAWDLDGDGLFDDSVTNQGSGGLASDSVVFTAPASPPNSFALGVRVFDGDGGQDTILFNVLVPEPTTIVMMGIGSIGLAFLARRRRKRA